MSLSSRFSLLPLALLFAGCGDGLSAGDDNGAVDDSAELAWSAADDAPRSLQQAASAVGSEIHPIKNARLCLDVVWGKNEDGAAVQLSECNNGPAQKWVRSGAMWKIYGDKCLNVVGGKDRDGTRLQIWTCNPSDKNNLWKTDGKTIRWSKNTEKCLDITGGKYASGTPVQMWTCTANNNNQEWTFSGGNSSSKPSASQPSNNTPTKPTGSTSGQTSVAPDFQVGMHIDYDNAQGGSNGVTGFVQRTGIKPVLVANYVRAKGDGSFELGTANWYTDDAAKNGAKIINFAVTSEVQYLSSQQLQGIGEAVAYARSKGLQAEVRFGYEMNGYWSPSYHNNNPWFFKDQWSKLAPVVRKAGGTMNWSPNIAGNAPDTYKPWLPDDLTTIDKIGLDYYVELTTSKPTVDQARQVIGGIYPIVEIVNAAHKKAGTNRVVPFTFGETAVNIRSQRSSWSQGVGQEMQLKQSWLTSLTDASLQREFPLYKGFTWFDYYKTELSGGTTGVNYSNSFELSQDPLSAKMFKSWYQKTF